MSSQGVGRICKTHNAHVWWSEPQGKEDNGEEKGDGKVLEAQQQDGHHVLRQFVLLQEQKQD